MPVFTELYKDSTPRGLVVSAYKNVVINHFILIGDPDCDYRGNPVIAVQYQARNVVLNNISIKEFKSASSDIKVYGGENRADSVFINNVEVFASAVKAIDIGEDVEDIHVLQVNEREKASYHL
jgi:hypothetical protein